MDQKKILGLMVFLLLSGWVLAEPRIDSVSIQPDYVEAGYDIDVKVKVSEGLVKRNLYSAQRQNGSKIPQQDTESYYVGTLSPANRYTNQQAIITEPERDIGHLFSGESWTVPF
ncbi:MAG: hypothetical protein GF334_01005, partial [Candidatus Altiarchaeales archaeon]|nr:hypothetical protein [Candidatus Altiarchaeales archaeon]